MLARVPLGPRLSRVAMEAPLPELPEVETVVRGLRPELIGKKVNEALALWAGVLDGGDPTRFNACLKGRAATGIHRRGKYICIDFEGVGLVVHLRMTGRLYFSEKREGNDPWVRFSLGFDDRTRLIFSDARKFGRVSLVESFDFLEQKLGPEPLTISDKQLAGLIVGGRRPIKTFLLDQKKIAGIGNIYADEALHIAGIRPTRAVADLSKPKRLKLAQALQLVLERGIDHEGATIGWYRKPDGAEGSQQEHFKVYGRGGQPCHGCGRILERIVLAGRGTHYCPTCQL